jgi:transposase InsO family protein
VAEPGLVRRRHLYPDAAWLPLPRGDNGLSEPEGSRLAAVELHGGNFCVAALEKAIARYGKPDILNSPDEGRGWGSQFASLAFTDTLRDAGIRIGIDGRGRWMDNVFIDRLWRSLKYECVYLHAFDTGSEARAGGVRSSFRNAPRRPSRPARERCVRDFHGMMGRKAEEPALVAASRTTWIPS